METAYRRSNNGTHRGRRLSARDQLLRSGPNGFRLVLRSPRPSAAEPRNGGARAFAGQELRAGGIPRGDGGSVRPRAAPVDERRCRGLQNGRASGRGRGGQEVEISGEP